MSRTLLRRATVATVGAAAITLALAAPASAHVTVNPKSATKGGYTKVAFRVPNEKDSGETTKLEVNLPTDKPIASVSLKPLPGWTATSETTKLATPIKSDDGEITEAISKITWTAAAGAAIKPGQFQEFEVSLGPLPDTDQVVFKALQYYSDGDVVRWIDEPTAGGAEPDHPAPVLTLTAADGTTPPPVVTSEAKGTRAASEDSGGNGNGTAYGIAGIVLGLAGLAAGLLAYRRAGQAR
jgi:uncharacterized protein YcnI